MSSDTPLTPLEGHPLAEAFPSLPPEDYERLRDSIKSKGFYGHCTTLEGKLLDGLNRQRACFEIGVTPVYQEYAGECGDPVSFVIAANINRRHLTASQRAMAVSKVAIWLKETSAKGRPAKSGNKGGNFTTISGGGGGGGSAPAKPPAKGKSHEQAAKQARVSPSTMQQATKVAEKGTKDLQEAVRDGKMAVSKAAGIATLSADEQLAAIKESQEKARQPAKKKDPKTAEAKLVTQLRKVWKLADQMGLDAPAIGERYAVVAAEEAEKKRQALAKRSAPGRR